MKKACGYIIAVALFATSLAGCTAGGSAAPSGGGAPLEGASAASPAGSAGVTINYLGLTDWKDLIEIMATGYREVNPDVEIVTELYPYEQMIEVIEVKLGSGDDTIDMIATNCPEVPGYVNRGYLYALNDYFTEADLNSWVAKSRDWGTVDGMFYAPPMNSSSQLLYYNKDLLDEAGVAYPGAKQEDRLTWEQVAELSRQVMDAIDPDRNSGKWGLLFEQVDIPYQILALPNSLGGVGVGADGFTVEGIIDDDAWVRAMTYYYDMFNTWQIAPKGMARDQSREMFFAGNVAFWAGGPWQLPNLVDQRDMNWGYAPHPYFEGGQIAIPTDSWHIAVGAYSKHPKEAAEFLRWHTVAPEGTRLWFENEGNLPCSKELLQEIIDATSGIYTEEPLQAYKICAYDEMNYSVPRPRTIGFREWDFAMTETFQDIRNGSDVNESLQSAVEKISSAMAKYQK